MTKVLARRMQGAGGGGSSSSSSSSSTVPPDTIATLSYLRAIDLICEGPVKAIMRQGLQSLYLNGVAVALPNGNQNTLGLYVETRQGLPTQSPLSGFPDTESIFSVGTQVKAGVPIIQSVTDPLATLVRFAIQIPSLVFTDHQGSVSGATVLLSLDVAPSGGAYTQTPITITGKTTAAQVFTYEIPLPTSISGSWDLRVTRISPDSVDVAPGLQDDTIWSGYVTVSNHQYMYMDRAVVGLQVDSYAVGGNEPIRTYLGDWKIVSIPSNYNSLTRNYTGIWDGTFIQDWTNNPAWVLYDILSNDRYGMGRFVGNFLPDKFALYAIAQYCDGLVDDGFGGKELRYTFNGSVQASANTQEDAMRVIQGIASVFNGNVYWGSNTCFVWADMPADSVALVTPQNVINGQFIYSGSSKKTEHTVALVAWRDPGLMYQGQLEVVTDPQGIVKRGWNSAQISSPGVTSRGQAHRLGRWLLDTEQHSTELVTYTASLDHAAVMPGDVITLADPAKRAFRGEGRLASIAPMQATLDAPFTFLNGVTYQLAMIAPDGTGILANVTNAPGSTAFVLFDVALTTLPITGSVWVMRCSNAEPRLFRVLRNAENDQHLFEITALLYDPTKFDRIESNLNLVQPPYTAIPSGPLATPLGIVVDEHLVLAGGVTIRALALFGWSAAIDPRVTLYEFQIGAVGSGYGAGDISSSTTREVFDLSPGLYNVRVRSASATGGLFSAWITTTINLVGQFEAPDDVTNFNITVSGLISLFSWDPDTVLNHDHYEIRYSPQQSGVTWGGAVTILDNIQGVSAQLPTASGSYLIKAWTTKGVQSKNAAEIVTSVDPGTLRNVVLTLTESSAFLGFKTGTVVTGGDLQLSGLGHMHDWPTLHSIAAITGTTSGFIDTGTYFFSNWIDCGAVMTSRVTFNMIVDGFVASYTMHAWGFLHSVQTLEGANLVNWSVKLLMRTTNDNPTGVSPANVLTNPITFNAGWTFTGGTVTQAAALGWDGNQVNAWKITSNVGTDNNSQETTTNFTGSAETVSFRVKAGTAAAIKVTVLDTTASTEPFGVTATWGAGAPTITAIGSITSTVTSLGSGWYKIAFTYTGTAGHAQSVRIYPAATDITGKTNFITDIQQEKLSSSSNVPVWSNWTPLTFSDVTCRAYEFMLVLDSADGKTSPNVSTLAVSVDVPDRFESAATVSSGAGVKVVTFNKAFQTLGGVAVAGLNMATGDYFNITAKSVTGFSVEFFNSSNTPVSRNFDWIARGYGQLA